MIVKRAAEVRTFSVDLSGKLVTKELLSGTATVAEIGSAELTIDSVTLTPINDPWWFGWTWNWSSIWPFGRNRGVQFRVAGGTAGRTYTLRITVGTDTTVQTLIQEVQLRVN